MRIHLIALGGSVMHNLALALAQNGHQVSGSDDEIYDPARTNLQKAGLLPDYQGWNPYMIINELDAVIVGMHARKDNPELIRAIEKNIPVYSFPSFIGQHSQDKKRLVVAGSHGKTTTTSMIMHVLKYLQWDFDYLVGAQLDGFDTMVRLSNAPIIVLEGDEYLSSPLDTRPKFFHYDPDILIITGIAWDHINVFPTFDNYRQQFEQLILSLKADAKLIWYQPDIELQEITSRRPPEVQSIPYHAFPFEVRDGKTTIMPEDHPPVEVSTIGQHNVENMMAAYLACKELGVKAEEFLEAISQFRGAARRLQLLAQTDTQAVFLDFAHAPSKVNATTKAVKAQYPGRKLIACLELHTFSSLNPAFISLYAGTLDEANTAIVFYSEHTLEMKKLPPLSEKMVKNHFKREDLQVFTNKKDLEAFIDNVKDWNNTNLLFMSSGRFQGMDVKQIAERICSEQV